MNKGKQPSIKRLGLLFILLFSLNCTEKVKTPEQQIKEFINQGIQAIESNNVSAVLPFLSESYKDQYGRDYEQMKSLTFYVLRKGQVTLFIEKINMAVSDTKAQVSCELIGLQGKHEKKSMKDFLPHSARRWSLNLNLILEQKKWKLNAMTGDGFHYGFD